MKLILKTVIVLMIMVSQTLHAQIDSGFVSLKKCNLFYKVYGEGEPILFLNSGYGVPNEGYEEYAKLLSNNNKVIVIDQRGTGKSIDKKRSKPHRVKLKLMVEDLESLRKHLGYDKWIVMGDTFGGAYASYYSMLYPEKIEKLILSATMRIGLKYHLLFQQFKEPEIDSLTLSELLIIEQIIDEKQKAIPSKSKLQNLQWAEQARFYVKKPENYQKMAEWMMKYERSGNGVKVPRITQRRIKKKLKDFNQPVLILHGSHDFINIASPIENQSYYKNSTLKIIENSGHFILRDQPAEYKQLIYDFLVEG